MQLQNNIKLEDLEYKTKEGFKFQLKEKSFLKNVGLLIGRGKFLMILKAQYSF